MIHLVQKVLSEQAPSGAFYSTVLQQGRQFLDENALVTNLVLCELAKLPRVDEVQEAIQRGLGYLETCVADQDWRVLAIEADALEPKCLKRNLIPRSDDLALSAMTLVRHGLMSLDEASLVAEDLEICRLRVKPVGSFSWVEPGSYKTWMDAALCPNRVDCVVNANVAAFLKYIDMDDSEGYRDAVRTVCQGVCLAIQSPSQTSQLSPYHPDPCELAHAMERAVEVGVLEFEEYLEEVRTRLKPMRQRAGLIPFCGSGDKQTLWFSPSLQIARTLSKHLAPTMAFSA